MTTQTIAPRTLVLVCGILILLTFFASLFAFVWATGAWNQASAGTVIFIALGLIAAGSLMLISAVFIVTFIRSINK